jgi:hypothetical protein
VPRLSAHADHIIPILKLVISEDTLVTSYGADGPHKIILELDAVELGELPFRFCAEMITFTLELHGKRKGKPCNS